MGADVVTANITLYAKWIAYSIGDTGPGGGQIFYVDSTGFTMTDTETTAYYLAAAYADMATTLSWSTLTFAEY